MSTTVDDTIGQTACTVTDLADELREQYGGDVAVDVHDDGTAMTPMLSVRVASARTRADVLRDLYEYEDRGMTVDAVHNHRIVVRASDS